jgi:hypothetical protein
MTKNGDSLAWHDWNYNFFFTLPYLIELRGKLIGISIEYR